MRVLVKIFIIFTVIIKYTKAFEIPYDIISDTLDHNTQSSHNGFASQIRKLKDEATTVFKRNRSFVLTISLGSPKQKLRCKITSLLQGIWVIDQTVDKYGYSTSDSTTFQQLTTSYLTVFGKGIIASDILRIPELSIAIDSFPFYLLSKADYGTSSYEGFIGFGYDQEERGDLDKKGSYDLLSGFNLINNSLKRLLGFKTLSAQEGILSIGDYSEEIKANMKAMRYCQVITKPNNHQWECGLNSVYFDNNAIYTINTSLEFKMGSNLIIVDQEFFSFLIKNYFETEIEMNKCQVTRREYIEVSCEKGAYDKKKIGSISFVFGKWSLKVRAETLFYDEDGRDFFAIASVKQFVSWYISPGMLIDYSVYFDRDNARIGFYLYSNQN